MFSIEQITKAPARSGSKDRKNINHDRVIQTLVSTETALKAATKPHHPDLTRKQLHQIRLLHQNTFTLHFGFLTVETFTPNNFHTRPFFTPESFTSLYAKNVYTIFFNTSPLHQRANTQKRCNTKLFIPKAVAPETFYAADTFYSRVFTVNKFWEGRWKLVTVVVLHSQVVLGNCKVALGTVTLYSETCIHGNSWHLTLELRNLAQLPSCKCKMVLWSFLPV